jgi:NAD(P)-dependent dehydrogenase (short-subunit alcohol dehydrogenase family)
MSQGFDISDQHVIVTGGTRGIGRAIALHLARAGASVTAVHVRNEVAAKSLLDVATTESLKLETLRADLTSAKGLESVLAAAASQPTATLSIVHCAATGVHRPVAELSMRHWDWTQALNVRAFFELVHGALPRLATGSSIVALSSAGAARAVPGYAAIGSSKGALESLARHLAVELAPQGVRVNVLSPGSVRTEAWDAFPDKDARLALAVERTPSGSLVTADEVAEVAHFLLSPAARSIVGQTVVVDGGARILE